MTGLLESAVRKLSFVWPTTEVSPHSAGYEGVPRVWPFNATEKLDPDVRELLSMHCSWCVLNCDQAHILVRLGRQLLLELCLRPDFGPHGAVRFRVFVGFGW